MIEAVTNVACAQDVPRHSRTSPLDEESSGGFRNATRRTGGNANAPRLRTFLNSFEQLGFWRSFAPRSLTSRREAWMSREAEARGQAATHAKKRCQHRGAANILLTRDTAHRLQRPTPQKAALRGGLTMRALQRRYEEGARKTTVVLLAEKLSHSQFRDL
ncbi:hypothetical protein AAFF_G00305150 [Aldrovandia affinis]|uniref:Uncharacterized protein n=1 Tax=Aldrovandia affinis TaxID=143900 RepID=A0AAD7SP49_9TELE|nr:hypothetical protein AAFF_G00305150 [Aldrovandia affinis]